MLVLSRFKGESIYIGSEIIVSVCGIKPDKVRIGIEAPKYLKILRSELSDDGRERVDPQEYLISEMLDALINAKCELRPLSVHSDRADALCCRIEELIAKVRAGE